MIKGMVQTPNVQLVRRELPHGSIKRIGEALGIPAKTVSEFFMNGWHQGHSNAILTEAMSILRDKYPDQELLNEFNELGLSQGRSYTRPRKSKSSPKQGGSDALGWAAILLGGVVTAYFAVPAVKAFFDANLFGKGIPPTPEDDIISKVQEASKPK